MKRTLLPSRIEDLRLRCDPRYAMLIKDNCRLFQPNITKETSSSIAYNKKFEKGAKFSRVIHYDDTTLHVHISANGDLHICNPFNDNATFNKTDAGEQFFCDWKMMPLGAEIGKSKEILITKDRKNNQFPNQAIRPNLNKVEFNEAKPFKGDYLYIMADNKLTVLAIKKNGDFYTDFKVEIEIGKTEKDDDKKEEKKDEKKEEKEEEKSIPRFMVQDSNIMILKSKKLKVFQFQSNEIEEKQEYDQFKDVEDIAIVRFNGMRLFKAKGAKGKFKVFSTLPSSDWNPYIEGVNKKDLFEGAEYPKIELIESRYGNVAIMVYTGKYYKYFVV